MAKRIGRLFYVFAVTTVAVFFTGMLAVAVIERWGPSDESGGRVIDRGSETITVRNCGFVSSSSLARRTRCRETEYPAYSVIGEREDGTTWISVGEGPYRAMGGERAVTVESSTVTGRVVGLTGVDDDWDVSTRGDLALGIGAFVVGIPLLVAYEWSRRSGRLGIGRFERRTEFLAVVPGLLLGLFGFWQVTWAKTWNLDIPNSAERYGGFLDDPLDYLELQEELLEQDNVGQLDRRFGTTHVRLTVVRREHLARENQAAIAAAGDSVLVVPVLQEGRAPVALRNSGSVEAHLVDGDTEHGAVDCPAGLVDFPTTAGADPDLLVGFVCFDDGIGSPLRFTIGRDVFAEAFVRSYELPDGMLVEAGLGG